MLAELEGGSNEEPKARGFGSAKSQQQGKARQKKRSAK